MRNGDSHSHHVRPTLECLEDRLTPDATSYVNGLYTEVLNRPGSQADVNFWVQQLNGGASRERVAASFWLSPEHRGQQVDAYYADFLNRPADAAGRQYWVNRFVNGGLSEIQVQLGFLTSQEYRNLYPTNAALVQALYQDVLNRAADPNGQAFWESQLNGGASVESVARGILTSPEGLSVAVREDYTVLLNRPADPNGLQFWVNRLRDGDLNDTEDFSALGSSASDDNDNSQAADNFNEFFDDINDNNDSLEEVAVRFLTSPEFVAAH